MDNTTYKQDILELVNGGATKVAKYRRNLRAYEASKGLNLNDLSDRTIVGYYNHGVSDATDLSYSLTENLIASVVETLVSDVASKKVRPFFTTINGASYKDMQACRIVQEFFDSFYKKLDFNALVTRVFKDCCVFDTGAIFVDRDNNTLIRVMPWQLFFDPREVSYSNTTKVVWKMEDVPSSMLPFKTDKKSVTVYRYFNTVDHKEVYWCRETDYYKVYSYPFEVLPFAVIHYGNCTKGSSSQSLVDKLVGLQLMVDVILDKIKESSILTSSMTAFVPEGSTIKTKKLTNRAGDIITYTPTANMTGSPVTVVHNPPVDANWVALLQQLKTDAYEISGVSQLSASSKKPSGLNSGVALQTMEDIESARFEVQLNKVVRLYTDVARLVINLFEPTEDILPSSLFRGHITWQEVKDLDKNYQLDFSAMNYLSNDPSVRYQQLQLMKQAGAISSSRISTLMENPDIQQGYSLMNNSINAVMVLIDNCMYQGDMTVPEFVSHDMLKDELLNTMLSLLASGNSENQEVIQRLQNYYTVICEKDSESQTNAEAAAVMSLQQELQTQLPTIQQNAIQAGIDIAEEQANESINQ